MNSYSDIRFAVLSTFKGFHDSLFPSVPANYPNYALVDTEHLEGPFISVQLSFNTATEVYDVVANDDIVRGEILISYLYPVGTGSNGSSNYSDMLRTNLSNKKIQGVTFFGLSILEVSPAPGIVGQMNILPFMI